jgi:hypothetical protein
VPVFRKGRFDQLDDRTSPFNVAPELTEQFGVCLAIGCPTLPAVLIDADPEISAASTQGGMRVSGTAARIDWSVAAYRGFDPFGLVEILPSPPVVGGPLTFARRYPRFTMIGGDFETVRGAWGIRGEVAAFVEDSFQRADAHIVQGSSIDAGVGVDRKAGNYRLSGSVLLHQESQNAHPVTGAAAGRNDLSLIGSADRSFSRERYNIRSFAVLTPSEPSAFMRAIATASLQDNVALEGSAGWFAGRGRDFTGRFADCDFLYVRLKYYF